MCIEMAVEQSPKLSREGRTREGKLDSADGRTHNTKGGGEETTGRVPGQPC